MGRSHSLPGKPLYALKQRLVSSTITAPPICMRQHSVAYMQFAVLHGSTHNMEGMTSQTPAQQQVCTSLWQCLLALPVMTNAQT